MVEMQPLYGDIVSFYTFGQLNIILNTDRIVKEAFVKRPEDFSHRAEEMVFTYIDLHDDVFMKPYNETWKKNKRFALATLKTYGFGTPKSEEKIHDQLEQFEDFLLKSKESPLDISHALRVLRTGEISSIMFGGNPTQDEPEQVELVKLINEWVGYLGEAFMIPLREESQLLARIIGWRALRKYASSQKDLVDHIVRRIEDHTRGISEKEASDVIDGYLKERGTEPDVIEDIAHTILQFLPDAIDTSSVQDHWMVLHVVTEPDIQKKLQKEVDSVCGSNRRPALADRSEMNYTQAVIYETLRHHTILPLSLPRILKKDITLEGYNLPKGALVRANLHGASMDPDTFPNPEKFDPSRFIKNDGTLNLELTNKIAAFSHGARKCVGEPFFKVTSFLFLTRLVQRFNLTLDSAGQELPTGRDEELFIPQPTHFKICFKPR